MRYRVNRVLTAGEREIVIPISHEYTHLHDARGKLHHLKRAHPDWRLEVEAVTDEA